MGGLDGAAGFEIGEIGDFGDGLAGGGIGDGEAGAGIGPGPHPVDIGVGTQKRTVVESEHRILEWWRLTPPF